MKVVVSGVGVVSPFGCGAARFFAGLSVGASAVGPIRHLDAAALPVKVAGEVPHDFQAARDVESALAELNLPVDQHMSTALHEAERLGALRDRKVAFGLIAASEAWRDARCGESERAAPLLLGLGLELGLLDDLAALVDPKGGQLDFTRDRREPMVRLRTPVDLCARAVHRMLGLRQRIVVNASACAASALAIADGAALILRGQADVVLCGGADSMVNPLGLSGMSRLGAPSPRAAADACRPFDRRRDGLCIGEGAAIFVLEDEARARARGARIYAELAGFGSTQDGYRVTAPLPDGSAAARAMQRAMQRAALCPRDVGYVNAHGTGTPLNDPAEARAIASVLGDVAVSSIKGAVGHLMAAAGAIEMAACLLCFTDDLLPGTAHHAERDADCPINVIGPQPRRTRVGAVLSNSFGFGGQNACLALRRVAA